MAATRKRLVGALCTLAALVVLGVAAGGLRSFFGTPGEGAFYDENARAGQSPVKTPEERQAELDRVVEEGMFNISVASVIDFPSSGAPGTANIENVPGNRYDMKASLVLDDTGEEVYASGGIAPGDFIPEIVLSRELSPGAYAATVTFTALDRDTHAEVGTAAARVTLMIGGA